MTDEEYENRVLPERFGMTQQEYDLEIIGGFIEIEDEDEECLEV